MSLCFIQLCLGYNVQCNVSGTQGGTGRRDFKKIKSNSKPGCAQSRTFTYKGRIYSLLYVCVYIFFLLLAFHFVFRPLPNISNMEFSPFWSVTKISFTARWRWWSTALVWHPVTAKQQAGEGRSVLRPKLCTVATTGESMPHTHTRVSMTPQHWCISIGIPKLFSPPLFNVQKFTSCLKVTQRNRAKQEEIYTEANCRGIDRLNLNTFFSVMDNSNCAKQKTFF